MAVHELVTGVNGAGKTLYTLSAKVQPIIGQKFTMEDRPGEEFERRLLVNGVRDLILPHVHVDSVKAYAEKDWPVREPGDPPLDVHQCVENWWLWVQPGDVLLIDEAQRIFRPRASGAKVPMFEEKLETARHYGLELIYVTQHPQLVNQHLRNLIGKHEHIRRLWFGRTVVYEWDHCSNPDRTKNAVSRMRKHDRKAFKFYRSAELHTKHSFKVPAPLVLFGVSVLALPFMAYGTLDRMADRFDPESARNAQSAALVAAEPSASAPKPGAFIAAPSAALGASAPSEPDKPVIAGCINLPPRCECIDAAGRSVEVDLQACQQSASRGGVLLPYFAPHAGLTAPVALPPPQAAAVEAPGPSLVSLGGDPRSHVRE